MPSNPLHELCDSLQRFLTAVEKVHQATTRAEWKESLNAWRNVPKPAQPDYSNNWQRCLADPVLEWLSQRGKAGQDHIATVENAAAFVVMLAGVRPPVAYPKVYANKSDAWPIWEKQMELLLAASNALQELQRLAALAGDRWPPVGDSKKDAEQREVGQGRRHDAPRDHRQGSGAELLDLLEIGGTGKDKLHRREVRDLLQHNPEATAAQVIEAMEAAGVTVATIGNARRHLSDLGKPLTLQGLADRLNNVAAFTDLDYRKRFLDSIPEWPLIRYTCERLFDLLGKVLAESVRGHHVIQLTNRLRFEVGREDAGEVPLTEIAPLVKTLLKDAKSRASGTSAPSATEPLEAPADAMELPTGKVPGVVSLNALAAHLSMLSFPDWRKRLESWPEVPALRLYCAELFQGQPFDPGTIELLIASFQRRGLSAEQARHLPLAEAVRHLSETQPDGTGAPSGQGETRQSEEQGSGSMSDYEHLTLRILSKLTGELLPETSWHVPERNEQRIAIAVCDGTGMSPERWDRLSKDERIPWLHKTLKALEEQPTPNVWIEGDDLPSHRSVGDLDEQHETPPAVGPTQPAPKRSTERGEGRTKLIAALTKHHQYADGGCLNLEPIGNNELAKAAGVSPSTASAFFNDKFQGHTKYKALCRDAGKLVAALKLLNDEFAPYHLFGTPPPDLATTDDDHDDDK